MSKPEEVVDVIKPITEYMHVVFSDLVDLAGKNPHVFEELYYNRETEFTLFRTIMEDAHSTAINVLIVGDAGVGKSNFIYKLVGNKEALERLHLYPIKVDYRNQMPRNANGCLLHFLRSMEEFFRIIGHPIHTYKEFRDDLITYNMQMCHLHLESLTRTDLRLHPLIVLDDFDYAEEEWARMLEYFLPFATSERSSVVFTLRPLLLANIEQYDDRFTHYYLRNCRRIVLAPLDAPRVLATRLALLLQENEEQGLYGRIRDRVCKNCNGLKDVLRQLNIRDVNDLPHFAYPFTERHNVFMKRITNGNLREIFDIASDSLVYMFDKSNAVEIRTENGVERRSLGRKGDIDLFMGTYARKETSYKMIDLHRIRSTTGNSLLYNVLEMVKVRPVVDDTFMKTCEEYGHGKRDVDFALGFLSDRVNRLMTPIRLRPMNPKTLAFDIPEYQITDKGEYYLQICDWDEYKARCKHIGRSILKDYQP